MYTYRRKTDLLSLPWRIRFTSSKHPKSYLDMRNQPAWFSFTTVLFSWWSINQMVLGAPENVTVDDSDSSIVYQPTASWHPSTTPCSTCLNPDAGSAFHNTYHNGVHVAVPVDTDDIVKPPDDDTDDNDDDDNKSKGKKTTTRRALSRVFVNPRLDGDDAGFKDTPVTVKFNFTGSAVYLFCIQPLGASPTTNLPTAMNLSFTLDNHTFGNFMHDGSQSAVGYLPNTNVFTQEGLSETPHILIAHLAAGSVFIFDYMIYTHSVVDAVANATVAAPQATTVTTATTAAPSTVIDESTKRHNVATFGGAVGGSVGVLGVFALGLAISIIRRRRLSARRDRLARESLCNNGAEDSPPMSGPAPFVPRFFPGTIIPTDPPPYSASVSSSITLSRTMPMVSTGVATLYRHPPDMSYADVPPSTPPPLDDGIIIMTPPPPPFGAAISAPAANADLGDIESTAATGAEEVSHTPTVGLDATDPSPIVPINVPLPVSRPESITSEQPCTSQQHQEDRS
ncbi:hypothetical protein BD779DRAFT_777129 [Infundibulicybe gibba]|nr:hypothetical protein BD779DRAFT_777129 [Infundibulicybe gibba]